MAAPESSSTDSRITQMIDHSMMKLGKRAMRHDHRTLMLARYLTPSLPAAPASVDYSHGITDWGMMLNDRYGCCTIAAIGHAVQTWTANALGRELTVPDSTILKYYEQWDGYNPANSSTDQGGVELDVLKHFQQEGFDSTKLDAFAAVDFGSDLVKSAIWLFGGAYIGVELPIRAQDQDVWDVGGNGAADQAGSWGGHAIYLVEYDDHGLTCITWGKLKRMTWAWFHQYCSEAYALISEDWLGSNGKTPSGLDLDTMKLDLAMVKG